MESPDRVPRGSRRGAELAESLWHAKEIAALLQDLDVDGRVGLDQQDAQRRLERYGYNELESVQAASPLTLFLGQFRNVLIIVLLAAAGLSAIVGEVTDAMIILIIVFFSALLGFFQEYRAERAVEALKRMLAPTARVLRGGKPVVVSARELVPGDIMLLEAGDRVSADIRLLEAHALYCDEAPRSALGAQLAHTLAGEAPSSVLVGQAHRGNESFWFDGQDVAVDVIERSFRGVADEETRNPDARQGPHHDHIGPFPARGRRNHLAGPPLLQMHMLFGYREPLQKLFQPFAVQTGDGISVFVYVYSGRKRHLAGNVIRVNHMNLGVITSRL